MSIQIHIKMRLMRTNLLVSVEDLKDLIDFTYFYCSI